MYPVRTDIRSDEGIDILLRDEIASEGEYLSVRLNIVELQSDGIAGETVAQGVVQLMVMIEDSCNIIRQVRGTSALLLFCGCWPHIHTFFLALSYSIGRSINAKVQ